MSQQKAVLANTTNAVHRNAYNAAFYELGLGWHWDAATYDQLLPLDCKAERIRIYLQSHQSHLLNAYEPGFLAEAIETTKSRWLAVMAGCGGAAGGNADWAALHCRQIGV